MIDTSDIQAEASRLCDLFAAKGGQVVEADVLLPADTLLDLYGEDIRGRAYLTDDPLQGEMVLRPDFTVPVVQMHMESRADPARKQERDTSRAHEYVQVGYEVFDSNVATSDAEVFAAIAEGLDGLPVRAATGDIGILKAAVSGLQTTDARKVALHRHIWRPRRFRAPVPASRAALLSAKDPFGGAGPEVGLRKRAEVQARIDVLRAEAKTDPILAQPSTGLPRVWMRWP